MKSESVVKKGKENGKSPQGNKTIEVLKPPEKKREREEREPKE